MSLNRISAAEAASLIKHGYNIGLSGFTPAGTAKAVTAELAKIAEAEHAKGNPFQVGIFTGASTGESCDGVLSRAKAIRYRAPYTTNADFRKAVNNGEIAYSHKTCHTGGDDSLREGLHKAQTCHDSCRRANTKTGQCINQRNIITCGKSVDQVISCSADCSDNGTTQASTDTGSNGIQPQRKL